MILRDDLGEGSNPVVASQKSGTDMAGRLGEQTMEMNGGSTASYLARARARPCVPLLISELQTHPNLPSPV